MMRNKRVMNNRAFIDRDDFSGAFQITEEVLFPELRKSHPPTLSHPEEVESAGGEEAQLKDRDRAEEI